MEIRRTTRRCIHTFMHTFLPRIRRCWRGPRSMLHRFKNGAHHETQILAITSVSKRKHSSGNRISWTSGQGTEVHKILVTTCMIFKDALTLCCDSGRDFFPGGSRCVFVGWRGAPLCTPKDEHVTFKSRRARTRCEISKAELSTKQKSRPSQVYQSTSTQVVTEFRGPLDLKNCLVTENCPVA